LPLNITICRIIVTCETKLPTQKTYWNCKRSLLKEGSARCIGLILHAHINLTQKKKIRQAFFVISKKILRSDAQMPANTRAALVFIGGFLGAGKTTCIAWMARELAISGMRVVVVMNDQSDGLIDSQIASIHADSEQVAGGCFCCRSGELVEILKRQTKELRPDVILTEPVGSCTDLTATLLHPLREVYKVPMDIAPLAVVVDARRAQAHFSGRRSGLAKEVGYIWQKQLEEAEFIVINKVDLLTERQLTALRGKVALAYPKARLFCTSAASGLGMSEWLDAVLGTTTSAGETMAVDYATYARGEALLGWVNMEASVKAGAAFAPGAMLQRLAESVRKALGKNGSDIAHFKMSFAPARRAKSALSVVNVTMNGDVARVSLPGADSATSGKVLVNLRATGEPSESVAVVKEKVRRLRPAMEWEWTRCEAFRPSEPKPTHRIQKGTAL
jgi:G3E family GTPase